MIKTHYVLKFADSHNQYAHVGTSGTPTRSSNPNSITYWQFPEHAKKYAAIFPQYKLECYEVEFNLYEVME